MPITTESFGSDRNGAPISLFTLTNANNLRATITNYGAHLTQLHVPDRHGKLGNITLGFDNLPRYLAGVPYFGATVGRYANRIAGGRFTLDDRHYQLATNDGKNHLHGGVRGFDKVIWLATPQENALKLQYQAHDGEEGYPGALSVTVTFTLTDADELRIDYHATCQAPTILNLTNHAYFNLAGAGVGNVLDHLLTIDADHYLPVRDLIPTGEVAAVADTPMDFRQPRRIGERIADVPGGYDHNFCLNHAPGQFALAASVYEPTTGRTLEVHTDQPGVQLYTGNFLDGSIHGLGGAYARHGAFCLETQHYPDSPNQPDFPPTVLRPNETFRSTTTYSFHAR